MRKFIFICATMRYLLLLFCFIELLMVTWLQNFAGPLVSPIIFLGASLGIGFVYLKVARANDQVTAAPVVYNKWLVPALQALPFLVLSYLVFKTNKTIWWWQATQDNGVDQSDIIPQITILVQRFLAGRQPYQPVPYPGYFLFPTYLPLQWLPYVATELLHKDYRWIPVTALWLSSLYFFLKYRSTQASLLLRVLLPIWPLAAWYTILAYDNNVFKLTVEGLIAAYYLFVAANINSRRVLPLALGIAVCLLSRYSIIFWVPLCVGCCYVAGHGRKAIAIIVAALALFLICYWLPFMRKDPMIFLKGYQYHTFAAYGEWYHDLHKVGGRFYLYNGYGFTAWALKLVPGNLQHVLTIYQRLHLLLCSGTVVALFIYFRRHKAVIKLNTFLLFSFKVYLAVFYAFIQIPYKYLYLVPVLVSGALLVEGYRRREDMR